MNQQNTMAGTAVGNLVQGISSIATPPAYAHGEVGADLHQRRLPEAVVKFRFRLLEKPFCIPQFAHGGRNGRWRFDEGHPTKRSIHRPPIGKNFSQQGHPLSQWHRNLTEFGHLQPHLDNRVWGFEETVRFAIYDIERCGVLVTFQLLAKLLDSNEPSGQGRPQGKCNPHRTPIRVTPPPTALCPSQRQGSNDSGYRANCGPRIPPNNAPVLPGRPTLTKSDPPTHSPISLLDGPHSATGSSAWRPAHG